MRLYVLLEKTGFLLLQFCCIWELLEFLLKAKQLNEELCEMLLVKTMHLRKQKGYAFLDQG